MKNNIKIVIFSITSFILGLSFVIVSYANSYNSSEISYNTAVSGSTASNVKDAIDDLYKKTKSGAFSECPENMSCVEKPGVVMNVTGPGTVDKGTVYVGIGETNIFTVTPNNGYVLKNISCNNEYSLSSFNAQVPQANVAQTITITNPNTSNGATCQITFGELYMCVRAESLHTQGGKTFGSLGTAGILTSGDAFDCDVNRDGNFNPTSERFYYITDLDSNTAVLLYYSNTSSGVVTPSKTIQYHASNVNNQGPVTARADLPSLSQWKTTIYSNPRQITNENGETTTSSGTIVSYNYDGLAARLITMQELRSACGRTDNMSSNGNLDTCTYTMENTRYANTSLPYGYWLESVHSNRSNFVWYVGGDSRSTGAINAYTTSSYGARPAIEVLKSEISY